MVEGNMLAFEALIKERLALVGSWLWFEGMRMGTENVVTVEGNMLAFEASIKKRLVLVGSWLWFEGTRMET